MSAGRVKPDIGEIEVESDQNSPFAPTGFEDLNVRMASGVLRKGRVDFVTGITEQCLRIMREILIELEANTHPLQLGRDRQDALSR